MKSKTLCVCVCRGESDLFDLIVGRMAGRPELYRKLLFYKVSASAYCGLGGFVVRQWTGQIIVTETRRPFRRRSETNTGRHFEYRFRLPKIPTHTVREML